jgi:hypothetical protein
LELSKKGKARQLVVVTLRRAEFDRDVVALDTASFLQASISENLNYGHFININHLVTPIPEDKPSEEELFGAYWSKYGRWRA